MRRCRFPGACPRDAFLDGRYCYYHGKVADGLLEPVIGGAAGSGQLGGGGPVGRRSVMASSVIDDEQRELVGVLRALGATPEMARRALQKRDSAGINKLKVGGRKGNGVGLRRR